MAMEKKDLLVPSADADDIHAAICVCTLVDRSAGKVSGLLRDDDVSDHGHWH